MQTTDYYIDNIGLSWANSLSPVVRKRITEMMMQYAVAACEEQKSICATLNFEKDGDDNMYNDLLNAPLPSLK